MIKGTWVTLLWLVANLSLQSAAQSCTNGMVRLVGGPVESAGRVEVCINGVWGRVCFDLELLRLSWASATSDSRVVCRQLGYTVNTGGTTTAYLAAFGRGTGQIVLDHLGCTGTESSLLNCSYRELYHFSDCFSYNNDFGVVCPSSVQNCSNETLRLVNGSLESAGTVEICINGVWGTVCDNGWDNNDARVVCSQLGYNAEGSIAVYRASFGQGTGPILFSDVGCTGIESSLLNCSHTLTDCSHSSDAGVVCTSSTQSCTNETIRLVGGPLESAGRVEICINGVWVTVCHDGWDNNDARVVCRQLGYSDNLGGAIAVRYAGFGQGTGLVLLNGVGCTGTESSLLNCSRSGTLSCSHSKDAGVICLPFVQHCTNGTIRLVDGPVESAGRVEICINGVWGTVCDYRWDDNDARVVCRQLGYSVNTGEAIAVGYAAFGQGNGPVLLSNVECTGNESFLLSCSAGIASCSSSNDAGVVCPSSAQNCTNETLRLVDGPLESAGRVEICINEVWGTVCHDGWDNNDARVVCRQLGYSDNTGAAIAVFNAAFGQGTGPFLLGDVRCTGNESSLLSCSHRALFCSHSNDAGVVCPSSAQNCSNGTLRLVNGPVESAGTVEVCINGVWGTVCGTFSDWGNIDARVVCRQLGYGDNTGGVAIAVRPAAFGQGNGPVLLGNVGCTGTESSLLSCSHGVASCSHSYDAGVVCPPSAQSCTYGTLRLVDGPVESAGRVEICINGVWGTVCHTGWDTNDARVVCRQLGYTDTGAISVFRSGFGQRTTGPAFLLHVTCTGTESFLLSCSHWEIGRAYCLHSEDVGVVCQDPCQPNPCRNGGTCTTQGTTNYTCSCAAGFTGMLCETDPPDCEPTTCDNGGTCVEEYGPATHCICVEGFTGVKCTTCISVPPSSPMVTGGGTVNESATVTMTCEASGFPAPRIIWLKRNGAELTDLIFFIPISITNSVPTAWDSCELLSSSSLTINSVTVEDNGVYVCEVENGLSPTQMNSTTISVIVHDECEAEPCQHGGVCIDLFRSVYCNCNGTGYTGTFCEVKVDPQRNETRPVILDPPDNTTKLLFEAVNLTCAADGYPPPVFKWYRAGLLIPNAVQSFLYIDQVTPDLRGYYTCEAINSQDNVTSNPVLVTITNVFQYLTDVEVNTTITDDLVSEIMLALYSVQNKNSTVRVYTINLIHKSNATAQFLVTVVTNLSIADIQDALMQQFQSVSSALRIGLPITVSNMERYDGCEAIEDEPLNFNFPSILLSWPESNIGVTHSFPCPCLDNPGGGASQPIVTRTCRGNFISKAMWQPVDYHQCGFTDITFKLCETQLLLRTSPEQAATDLANITSNTAEISAVDVSVATSIIEDLTTAALTNEKVREGYLEAIDNLVQTDTTVIAMSQNDTQSSTRLIDSLTSFTDNFMFTNTTTATFTRKTYALQLHDVDTSNFQGQTLSIDLGSVQEAMSISSNIREEAIDTIEGNKVFLNNRTASVQVPASVFRDLSQNDVQQRLSYTVFVRDTLFQSSDENQSNLTVGSIIVAVRVNGSSASGNLSTTINVTFQASELIDNASRVLCSLWDPQANGARGAWITDSCDQNHTSSGSTPTPQSPENSMGAEVLTTMSTFTAQYSQPGHFGLLLDLNDGPLPPVYGAVLQSFSYVGLVISVVCLTAFIVTHLASRNLRQKEHEQILINLCLALMGMYLVFILGANAAPVPVLCGISAAFLQYFMLVFFSWTAVEAFCLYRKLVKIMGVGQIPVLKISLVVWLVPILIVVLCAGPGHRFYYLESKHGLCRSRDLPFYIGLIAPFAILYVFNLTMFILIMISICKHSYRRRGITTEKSTFTFVRKNATIAFSLAIVFGLGWAFGLAATSTPSKETTFTLQLLFTIFVGCQGLLIFFLHGIRKPEARNEWKKWFSTATSKTYDLYSSGKKLDSTATPSNMYVTSPLSPKYVLKTGTLPTDASFEMNSNKVEADTSIAAEHTATAKDSNK